MVSQSINNDGKLYLYFRGDYLPNRGTFVDKGHMSGRPEFVKLV